MSTLTDIVALDETILNADLPCVAGDSTASWRLTIRCCNNDMFLCDTHDAKLTALFTTVFFGSCGRCGHKFGWNPSYRDVYRRLPA